MKRDSVYEVWHDKVNIRVPHIIIRKDLNYFEAKDFIKILNKLYGK